jgi:hypothetical protein
MFAVTLASATLFCSSQLAAQGLTPQFGHKPASVKGPRAIGLVQLSPKGKARFTPIAIMVDGKFFDAGSYKAAPVPMALDFGVVYEGFRAGVSQGIFTITQPGQLNHSWIAEGTWLPAGVKAPETSKKYSTPVIEDDSKDAPPVLHRRTEKADSDSGSSQTDKATDKAKAKDAEPKPSTPPAGTATTPPVNPPATAPTQSNNAKPPATTEPAKTTASAQDETIDDPNRPKLRRGKPDTTARQEPYATFDAQVSAASATGSAAIPTPGKPGASAKDAAVPPPVTIMSMLAISDARGPDPRPYTYDVKPAEEAIYRNKMLELATAQLLPKISGSARTAPGHKTSAAKSSKTSKAIFDDVNLRIFDLSNSNEPVLILSAKTHPAADANGNLEEPKEVTLIARTNLEGELRKLFFSQTDSRHLDAAPRMELIDAVDADGDGRGELLFRRTSDDGSAYAIYRVSSDRLWPLFEGTP